MTNPRWEAYQSGLPIGIDLKRSSIGKNLGTYVVNESTTFRAGMLVQLNAAQEIVVCDGTVPMGFAKYDKTTSLYETVVDEYIQLNALDLTNLANANLWTGLGVNKGIRVASGPQGSGTVFTNTAEAGNDYTISTTNGTIVRSNPSDIGDGDYVYVTYMYEVPMSKMQFEGKNFWNTLNATEYTSGRMTVITDWSVVFTSQYDPSRVYAVNSVVEAGAVGDGLAGLVTLTGVGAGPNIGRVMQVPTAADPFLGVRFYGGTITL